MSRPVDAVTTKEAARILGSSTTSVYRLVVGGRLARTGDDSHTMLLSRNVVEALAATIYDWRQHHNDTESYWVTGATAAALLGVSAARLSQLASARRVPFVWHVSGVRLFRRAELETLAGR